MLFEVYLINCKMAFFEILYLYLYFLKYAIYPYDIDDDFLS